ncbi:hypothetical protein BDZ94DRAFT_1133825, partial [Collybia nuda]
LAALLLACTTLVSSTPVVPRAGAGVLDVFVPPILEPTASTVWKIGQTVTVTWDTSNAPENISNGSGVILKGTFDYLAKDFDLRAGSVDLVVPVVTPGKYQIILLGDSGNVSPEFTIE